MLPEGGSVLWSHRRLNRFPAGAWKRILRDAGRSSGDIECLVDESYMRRSTEAELAFPTVKNLWSSRICALTFTKSHIETYVRIYWADLKLITLQEPFNVGFAFPTSSPS